LPAYFFLADLCRFGDFDNTMGDRKNNHGDAAVATFSVAMCVILVSYLTLVLVPY
jgi:hypothetical protein